MPTIEHRKAPAFGELPGMTIEDFVGGHVATSIPGTPPMAGEARAAFFSDAGFSFLCIASSVSIAMPLEGSNYAVQRDWTSAGGWNKGELFKLSEPRRRVAPTTGGAVAALHARSGLTWDELAALFATSRRALNHWVHGGRLSAKNAARLEQLTRQIDQLGIRKPDAVRDALVAPDLRGRSLYSSLLADVRSRAAERLPFAATLGAVAPSSDRTGHGIGIEPLD